MAVEPPADLEPEYARMFRDICRAVEDQTGLADIDAGLIAAAVRALREEVHAVQLADVKRRAGDVEGWVAATRMAQACRRSHSTTMTALKISPRERSSRIGKAARGARAGQEPDSAWSGLL